MSISGSAQTPRASSFQRVLHSFRFRLTLMFVAILAIILVVFSIFIYSSQVEIVTTEAENRLAAQSIQLVAYYNTQLHSFEEESEGRSKNGPQVEFPLLPENAILAAIGSNKQVVQLQGELHPDILAAMITTWDNAARKMEPLAYKVPASNTEIQAGNSTYLFQVSPLQAEDMRGGYLLLATPMDPANQLSRLAVTLVLSSAVVLLLAFGGGFWLADRAMKPVQKIVYTAQQIGESDLSQRINLQREDELGELADTFDQMLDRLQAAFERQRQFTADASHELRSPLAIIELETDRILERPRTTQEYEEVLRLIQSENEWMSGLVNELLLLARMDAGHIPSKAERIDLSEVVVDVTERLYSLAQSKSVDLQTGSLGECFVLADRIYLTHLLTNLVENGIKYNQRSDGVVRVETASQSIDSQLWSLVQISDNGPGIPGEHLPYIFNRFYRMDKARSREVGEEDLPISGSGLGLAISKSIAEAYNGKIEVRSQAGEGTTFIVRLPAA